MKKGIEWLHCGSFLLIKTRYKVICLNCYSEEFKEQASLRMLKDYSLLFPANKLIGSNMELVNGAFFHHNYLNGILYNSKRPPLLAYS